MSQRLMDIPVILRALLMLCLLLPISEAGHAQNAETVDAATVELVPTTGVVEPSIELSVLRGNPDQGGGEITKYNLKSGEITFVQVPSTDIVKNQLQQINNRYNSQYSTEDSQLDRQIALKIAAIQNKQKEYYEEIYPAYRPPLELQKQQLEKELSELELQRNQIQSSERAKNNMQRNETTSVPPPPTRVASGYSIQSEITQDDQLIFTITSQGLQDKATQKTIQAPQGQWVQLMGQGQGSESELWIKAQVVTEGEESQDEENQ